MITMTDTLARNWWALGLRGLCALLFGLAMFVWPGISLFVLVLMFGVYTLLDGVFSIVSTVRSDKREKRWWLFLLQGVAGTIVGMMAFVWPGITALALVYLIAAWAIVTGIFEIVAAVQLRKEIQGEWLLGLGGIASVVFGVLLVGFPGTGALAVVWIIGAYSMLFGILLMALAFRLRHRNGHRSHEVRAREV
ncbi:MAG: HdeD family acid-resistance protein [Gammaproteobacteria bacterium]